MPLFFIFILSKFMYPVKNVNNTELCAAGEKSHSPPKPPSFKSYQPLLTPSLEKILLNCRSFSFIHTASFITSFISSEKSGQFLQLQFLMTGISETSVPHIHTRIHCIRLHCISFYNK